MKRVNIKDIARSLSISPSTVSRALTNHPDLSKETKERVQQAAALLNYVPNLHARYFRKKQSGLIALILPEISMFFVPGLLRGVNALIEKSNYSVITFFSNNQLSNEINIIKHCLSWAVEGVLLSVSEETNTLDHLEELRVSDIPLILLDRIVDSENYCSVTIDDYKAGYDAATYLIKKKKNKILGVFGNPNIEITQKRLYGFKKSFYDHGVPFNENNFIIIDKITLLRKELISTLSNDEYDGCFFMSDELLFHAHPILKELNLYPDKLSILIISDGESSYNIFPKVSHLHHSGFEVGHTACEILLDKISSKNTDVVKKIIDTHLIEMNSVI
jgi:LacI family transcriptional regulator